MLSRLWLSVFSLTLVLGFSGCDSAPVEEVDPFQTRGRSGTSAPPPTATFAPVAHSSDSVSDGSTPRKETLGPAAVPGGGTRRHAGAGGRNPPPRSTGPAPVEYDVVGEETIIDPDSHRGRAKKLRERQKSSDETAREEPEKKS